MAVQEKDVPRAVHGKTGHEEDVEAVVRSVKGKGLQEDPGKESSSDSSESDSSDGSKKSDDDNMDSNDDKTESEGETESFGSEVEAQHPAEVANVMESTPRIASTGKNDQKISVARTTSMPLKPTTASAEIRVAVADVLTTGPEVLEKSAGAVASLGTKSVLPGSTEAASTRKKDMEIPAPTTANNEARPLKRLKKVQNSMDEPLLIDEDPVPGTAPDDGSSEEYKEVPEYIVMLDNSDPLKFLGVGATVTSNFDKDIAIMSTGPHRKLICLRLMEVYFHIAALPYVELDNDGHVKCLTLEEAYVKQCTIWWSAAS